MHVSTRRYYSRRLKYFVRYTTLEDLLMVLPHILRRMGEGMGEVVQWLLEVEKPVLRPTKKVKKAKRVKKEDPEAE